MPRTRQNAEVTPIRSPTGGDFVGAALWPPLYASEHGGPRFRAQDRTYRLQDTRPSWTPVVVIGKSTQGERVRSAGRFGPGGTWLRGGTCSARRDNGRKQRRQQSASSDAFCGALATAQA